MKKMVMLASMLALVPVSAASERVGEEMRAYLSGLFGIGKPDIAIGDFNIEPFGGVYLGVSFADLSIEDATLFLFSRAMKNEGAVKAATQVASKFSHSMLEEIERAKRSRRWPLFALISGEISPIGVAAIDLMLASAIVAEGGMEGEGAIRAILSEFYAVDFEFNEVEEKQSTRAAEYCFVIGMMSNRLRSHWVKKEKLDDRGFVRNVLKMALRVTEMPTDLLAAVQNFGLRITAVLPVTSLAVLSAVMQNIEKLEASEGLNSEVIGKIKEAGVVLAAKIGGWVTKAMSTLDEIASIVLSAGKNDLQQVVAAGAVVELTSELRNELLSFGVEPRIGEGLKLLEQHLK